MVSGGHPWRILRLTPSGARLLARLAAGEAVSTDASGALARRLVEGGLAHPRPPAAGPFVARERPSVVVPVRGEPAELDTTLDSLGAVREVVVVDDASLDAGGIAAVARRHGATLVRHEVTGGPAAAREAGWRRCEGPVVAFVDAGVELPARWYEPLGDHLGDRSVVAVAPRVRPTARPGTPRWLARYEARRSPLDLGGRPAEVRPASPVAYVPTATLVVRRSALEEVGGFDPALRYGEDVDLVWRLVGAGGRVRYEPRVVVRHPVRTSLRALVLQRAGYGSAAGPLARRHGSAVAPARISPGAGAGWWLVASGAPRAAGVVIGVSNAPLVRRLASLPHPVRTAARLGLAGQMSAGRQLVEAARRVWAPGLAVAAALGGRRTRGVVASVWVLPPLCEALARRPELGLARWIALRAVDDIAYCAGVWRGSWAARTTVALRPVRPRPNPAQ